MNMARVDLPEWPGVVVSVIDGRLCAGRASREEDDDDTDGLLPVDFLCRTFLRDASQALSTDFTADEFDVVACDGCQRPDELALHITRTP